MNGNIVLMLSGIGLAALACQWVAWRVKLPAILFLLLVGIAAGPVTGMLDPEKLFAELLFPMVSLSVAVILFEGALTLKLDEISGLEQVVRNLITVGMGVSWLVTTVATHLILGFGWQLSFLFGAVVVVTGPTVIVPMLRTVRPNARVANILRWEGIMIDPLGAMLAVLVYEFIISSHAEPAWGHTVLTFARIIAIGLMVGAISGYLFGEVLRNHWLPEYLHNVGALTLVFGVFAMSNLIQEESGLLAVTVMGVWLGNMKNVPVDEIIDFKESLSILLISVLFIILAARVEFTQIQQLGWKAAGILVVIQFLARPLNVMASSLGSSLSWEERHLLAWIAPRGIVAAAVSALFAIRLENAGYENAQLLVPLTFIVIIGTVVLQSATARPIAQWLGVAEPEPRGFLVIGANQVARTIAKALVQKDYRALLADSNWENIKKSRMEGLDTYFGNPISEHADRQMDLVGIGRILALSPQGEMNTLANLHYRVEFGRNAIYTIQTSAEKNVSEKHKTAPQHKGYTLFGEEVTYSMLASMIAQGAEIRSTNLTESFEILAYKEKHGGRIIPMFAIDPKGKLGIFVDGGKMKPGPGWTIMSLVPAEEEAKSGEGDFLDQ